MIWRSSTCGMVCALVLMLTAACGDDESDRDSATAGEVSGDNSEGDNSEGDNSEGDNSETGNNEMGDGDTGDNEGETDEGETGEGSCADLEEQAACDDDPACQSVAGQPMKQNGPDAPCLEPTEYLGCIPMMGCDDAETWFCVGGNAKPHLVPDGCGPDNSEICDPPADPVEACP